MKLYYMPGSGALTIHLTLEAMQADYEAIHIKKTELKTPEYLKLNPQGLVPVLLDGDLAIAQNVAILNYLATKFPEKHIFGDNLATQATAWQWLAFCNSDLHKAFAPIFHRNMYSEDSLVNENIKNVSAKKIIGYLKLFEEQLENKEYLAGVRTPADFYLFTILRWARHFKFLPENAKNLDAFFNRLLKDPVVQKILTEEGLKLA